MKKRMLFLECASGISGDMTVAALLDLGADAAKMERVLDSLKLKGFDYKILRRKSYGMDGCGFDVSLHNDHGHGHPHDHHHQHEHENEHDHEHDHGHTHEHEHGHEHGHGHHHEHEHEHEHTHEHVHRNISDVYEVIDRGEMTDNARAIAKKAFMLVAESEAKAHNLPIEEVHFHEVGAIDSIVDIICAAVCFDDLGIDDCVVTGVSEGTGYVRCQHGDLPVPVPAVVNIAARYSIPIRVLPEVVGEMVTPTGIAIAAAIRTRTELPVQYVIEKIGVGVGTRDFGRPNLFRAMIISEETAQEAMWVVETNIDDSTGEQLGLAIEELMNAGANDAHCVPCMMKKTRPAYLLRVVVAEKNLDVVEDAIFRCTTTIGVRRYRVERTCLERSKVQVQLPYGTVDVKKSVWKGKASFHPEFESVKRLSVETGHDFKKIFEEAVRACAE